MGEEEEKQNNGEKIGTIFRDIRRYYCEFCGICRSKKSLLTSHLLSHHQEEMEKKKEVEDEESQGKKSNHTCEECGVSFKKPAHLKQHMLSHSFERPFVCPVNDCNASYRRKDHLNRHLLQHQGKLFKCPIENCDKEFAVQGNVSRHVKEFHKDKPEADIEKGEIKHVCPEIGCGKLNRHILQHQGKLFKCPIENCDKEFAVQANVYRHVKKFHKDKREADIELGEKHVCQENGCGKEFKYASQLRKHAESHVMTSSETFCSDPSCMKPFSNVECLRVHIRSCHQYVNCEVCGSKHLRKNYKRHLQTHEEHIPTTLKCSFKGCDHTFSKKSNLVQHVKAVHLELRPFTCSFPGCGLKFAFKHVRDNHEQTARHVYVPGDLEEFDEQFRSRSRGGRKRKRPCIETLLRKRISPPNQCDSVLSESSEFISWCLSDSDI